MIGAFSTQFFDDRFPRPSLHVFRNLLRSPEKARKTYKPFINEVKSAFIHEPVVITMPPWLFNNPYLLVAFLKDADFGQFICGPARDMLRIHQRGERKDTAKEVFGGIRERHLDKEVPLSSWWQDIRERDKADFENHLRRQLERWSHALGYLGQPLFIEDNIVKTTGAFGQLLLSKLENTDLSAPGYPWLQDDTNAETLADLVKNTLKRNNTISMTDIVGNTKNGIFKHLNPEQKKEIIIFCRSAYVDWNAKLSRRTRIGGSILSSSGNLIEGVDASSLFSDGLIRGDQAALIDALQYLSTFTNETLREGIKLLFTEDILDQFKFNDIPTIHRIGVETGYYEAWQEAFGVWNNVSAITPEQICAFAKFLQALKEFMGGVFVEFRGQNPALENMNIHGWLRTFLNTRIGRILVVFGTYELGPPGPPQTPEENNRLVYFLGKYVGEPVDALLRRLPLVGRLQTRYVGAKVIKSLADRNREGG